MGKLESMWSDGIFLGIKGTAGEFLIGDGVDIHRARRIQRRPLEDRWKDDNLKFATGVPWRRNDDDPNVDGEKRNR